MNDQRFEFPNSNGANGNGHSNGNGNIFNLTPKQDELLSIKVPAVRRKVCLNTSICEAARMFFCFLTDMSLLPGVNSSKGVVRFSDADLAGRFKVSTKTIRNWKRAVQSTGEVWLSEKWMKNSFAQTVYNITEIVGQQMPLPMNVDSQDGSLAEDQVYSSNRRRQRLVLHDPATGRFASRNTPPGVRPGASQGDNIEKTEENAPSEKILPPTTAIDCRPPRNLIAAHHGNELPSPTETDCRPERKPITAVDGNELPSSPETDCRSGRKDVADNKKAKDVSLRTPERSFKRSTGDTASESIAEVAQLRWEKMFLGEVGEVMDLWKKGHSKFELDNSGAWWRQSFRANRELVRKVLAETKCTIVERRIKKDPGSYAVDLWKRWQKDLLADVIKQKAAARTAART